MDIKDKVAVITGGASGMGRAIAIMIVAKGGKVVIFDVNADAGNAAVAEMGDSVIFAQVDVTDEVSVAAGIELAVAQYGSIHICINCAGIATGAKTVGKKGPFPFDLWHKTININLNGTFNVLRLCAEQMVKNEPVNADGARGVIINTASIAAFEGQIGQAAYSASKGGIIGMMLPIARDLAVYGIRVNTIVPGIVDTPMMASMPPEVYSALAKSVLNPQRLAKASEIAHLAACIIENDYINAESIRMDGGIRMQPK
jgi:3-hydroxyacyl-CoA dehydrogenase/3-hydroxy-2-methylbutyryl-CoA dehydrogenase